jgi:hypothetical protein
MKKLCLLSILLAFNACVPLDKPKLTPIPEKPPIRQEITGRRGPEHDRSARIYWTTPNSRPIDMVSAFELAKSGKVLYININNKSLPVFMGDLIELISPRSTNLIQYESALSPLINKPLEISGETRPYNREGDKGFYIHTLKDRNGLNQSYGKN